MFSRASTELPLGLIPHDRIADTRVAGLFLATQLSKLKISTRIIDKMAHPVLRGHADGLQCRTGEVFEAMGVQYRFDLESHECAGE